MVNNLGAQKAFNFTHLPRVHGCSSNLMVHNGLEQAFITVLRLGVHGDAIDGAQRKAVQAGHVEEPVAANNALSDHLVKPERLVSFVLAAKVF